MLHYDLRAVAHYHRTQCPDQNGHGPMKDNSFGSEAFILLTKMEMHALPAQRISNFPSKFGSWCTWCPTPEKYPGLHPPLLAGWGGGQGYFYQISKGGHLRFWTFSKTNFGPFLTKDAKLWTFLYGVWFRGLEILQNIQNCGPFSTLRGSEVQLFKKNTKFWTFF